ncbi:hypothetical protein [Erythrobacter sp. HKB08]|uniref:hypothetical protein n=1 Tax=Erythrobacter sp. HKB08 TaxID=2502843 RepID=UPI0010093316|nr:hypothetical protein [Erythrobacter sp. HKB08]
MKRARFWAIAMIAVAAASLLAADLFGPFLRSESFHRPGRIEFARAKGLFGDWLAPGQAGGTPAGFERAVITDIEGAKLLRERPEDCRGRGVYMARDGSARPLAIVAPHHGADRHTGPLALALFREGDAKALAWNSAPRRPSERCPGGGDVAREARHHMTAFSLAFAEAFPGGRIVQIHGFERTRRETAAGADAQIIVSEGSDTPSDRLLELADCLSMRLHPIEVAVYPIDVPELGALTNRQGRALREAGFDGFAHIELSAELRRRLLGDRELRDQFRACLEDGLA